MVSAPGLTSVDVPLVMLTGLHWKWEAAKSVSITIVFTCSVHDNNHMLLASFSSVIPSVVQLSCHETDLTMAYDLWKSQISFHTDPCENAVLKKIAANLS